MAIRRRTPFWPGRGVVTLRCTGSTGGGSASMVAATGRELSRGLSSAMASIECSPPPDGSSLPELRDALRNSAVFLLRAGLQVLLVSFLTPGYEVLTLTHILLGKLKIIGRDTNLLV